MTDYVNVPYGDDMAETARALLDAAEASSDHEQFEVENETGTATFRVPEAVAKAAGLEPVDLDADLNAAVAEAEKTSETPSVNAFEQSGETTQEPVKDVDAIYEPSPEEEAKAEAEGNPPAKKTVAKKTTARKTAAKKTSASK